MHVLPLWALLLLAAGQTQLDDVAAYIKGCLTTDGMPVCAASHATSLCHCMHNPRQVAQLGV